jgi:hypothetical protein
MLHSDRSRSTSLILGGPKVKVRFGYVHWLLKKGYAKDA